jgi:hypothetical protein
MFTVAEVRMNLKIKSQMNKIERIVASLSNMVSISNTEFKENADLWVYAKTLAYTYYADICDSAYKLQHAVTAIKNIFLDIFLNKNQEMDNEHLRVARYIFNAIRNISSAEIQPIIDAISDQKSILMHEILITIPYDDEKECNPVLFHNIKEAVKKYREMYVSLCSCWNNIKNNVSILLGACERYCIIYLANDMLG